jgi:hypothetical protein
MHPKTRVFGLSLAAPLTSHVMQMMGALLVMSLFAVMGRAGLSAFMVLQYDATVP